MPAYQPRHALELLRLGTGQPDAAFREGQEEAVRHLVEGRGRLLVVQKTGWGKSFVYFIAAMLLREQGHGPGLLISPLLALMRNQIAAARRMGVRAATINSDNQDDWNDVEASISRGEAHPMPRRARRRRTATTMIIAMAAARPTRAMPSAVTIRSIPPTRPPLTIRAARGCRRPSS